MEKLELQQVFGWHLQQITRKVHEYQDFNWNTQQTTSSWDFQDAGDSKAGL